MEDVKISFESYMLLYRSFMELNSIKELIRDNIECENSKLFAEDKVVSEISRLRINNLFFTEELLKLIKYTDKEFYNELEQQGKA